MSAHVWTDQASVEQELREELVKARAARDAVILAAINVVEAWSDAHQLQAIQRLREVLINLQAVSP